MTPSSSPPSPSTARPVSSCRPSATAPAAMRCPTPPPSSRNRSSFPSRGRGPGARAPGLPLRGRRRDGPLPRSLAARLLDAVGFELPAGRHDVLAARRAHRRGISRLEDDVTELPDRLARRAFVGRARPRIERDEVDLGGDAAAPGDAGAGLGPAVIAALAAAVFEVESACTARAWLG